MSIKLFLTKLESLPAYKAVLFLYTSSFWIVIGNPILFTFDIFFKLETCFNKYFSLVFLLSHLILNNLEKSRKGLEIVIKHLLLGILTEHAYIDLSLFIKC